MRNHRDRIFAYGCWSAIINLFTVSVAVFWLCGATYAADPVRIVAIGDSLTAGYGLPPAQDFPTQLQAALQEKGLNVTVENAGVSGDTTAGGLERIDWAVGDGADFILLELGANDALRGIAPAVTRANLDQILKKIAEKNIPVFMAGMRAPPNMGKDYAAEFDRIFPELAAKYQTGYYPFFLQDVAAIPELNQSDYIHPNAEGVKIIVDNMLPYVIKFINE